MKKKKKTKSKQLKINNEKQIIKQTKNTQRKIKELKV